MLFSIPFVLTLRILWDDLSIRIEAKRAGAILAPKVPDRSPGGIATLIRTAKIVKGGYLGKYLLLNN